MFDDKKSFKEKVRAHSGKRILDTASGVEYDSINQCVRDTGFNRQHVQQCINGARSHVNGHKLLYIGDAA